MKLLGKLPGKKPVDDEPTASQLQDLEQWKQAAQQAGAKIIINPGCDEVPGSYGNFGTSITNPIPVNGPIGEVVYLNRLRSQSGAAFLYHRTGSYDSPLYARKIDAYELVASDASEWLMLYFDMYHFSRSTKAPSGTRLLSWKGLGRGTVVIKSCYAGSRQAVENFPYGLPDAITNDTRLNSQSPGLGATMAQKVEGYLRKHEGQWARPSQAGTVLLARGDFQGAADKFRQAIGLNPNDTYARFYLAQAYEKLGQPAAAVSEYQEILRYEPDNSQVHFALLQLLVDVGASEAAIKEARALIRLNPGDARPYMVLGGICCGLGRDDEAVEAFRAVTRLDPNNARGHFNLGHLVLFSRPVEAITEMRKVLQLEPDNPTALYELGLAITLVDGKTQEVRTLWEKAATMDDDFGSAEAARQFLSETEHWQD